MLACRKRSNGVIVVAVVDTLVLHLDFDTNRVVGLSLAMDHKVLGVVSWSRRADAQRFAQVDVNGRRSHLGIVEVLRIEECSPISTLALRQGGRQLSWSIVTCSEQS